MGVTTLEAQNEALLEVVRKTATEQAKVTQSWAQIAAKAPAPPATTPSPPASFPSVPSGSLNPHSSISQTSNVSQSAIILDLSRTAVKSTDFAQLKDTISKALKDHDQTKDIQCVGLQRRAGVEHHVKVTFESEEQAKRVRKYDHWLRTCRFLDARILGEQWYPVKVDRAYRMALELTWSRMENVSNTLKFFAGSTQWSVMCKVLQILQANLGKRGMNDECLKD